MSPDFSLSRPPGSGEKSSPTGTVLKANGWFDAAILILVGGIMLLWSWGRWPDILVDYGRELYIPWQLANGKVLYRDILHVQGPFSQYLNALWFRIFGASLRTLVFCNLAILIGFTFLLHRVLTAISRRWVTLTALIVFLCLFAFAQFITIGNYNYICPYRHEATHGMTLAVLAIYLVCVYQRNPRSKTLAAIGLVLGLLFLTKGEIFLAGVGAVGFGLILEKMREERPKQSWLRNIAILAFSFVVPVLVAFVLLWSAMPATEALRAVLGSWPASFHKGFLESTFVRDVMGTLHLEKNLSVIGRWTFYYLAFFSIAAAISLGLRRQGPFRSVLSLVLFLVVLVESRRRQIHWPEFASPLPFLIPAFAVFLFRKFLKCRREPEAKPLALRLMLLVFAELLLVKMMFHAEIYHYGFVLAMPATLLLIVAALDWLPAALEQKGASPWAFRALSLGIFVTAAAWHFQVMEVRWLTKSCPVGHGKDLFFADRRADEVNQVLATAALRLPPFQTLTVFPEGTMLNFLLRKPSPAPYIDFLPTELFYYGEEKVLVALATHPPDCIALVHRDTSEYGFRFFGVDYGQSIQQWITNNYHEVFTAGAKPFQGRAFGISLLQRNVSKETRAAGEKTGVSSGAP